MVAFYIGGQHVSDGLQKVDVVHFERGFLLAVDLQQADDACVCVQGHAQAAAHPGLVNVAGVVARVGGHVFDDDCFATSHHIHH